MGHCQSKFYTACLRLRAGQSSTVFAHESPTRSAGFGTKNGLYLFALTVPSSLLLLPLDVANVALDVLRRLRVGIAEGLRDRAHVCRRPFGKMVIDDLEEFETARETRLEVFAYRRGRQITGATL